MTDEATTPAVDPTATHVTPGNAKEHLAAAQAYTNMLLIEDAVNAPRTEPIADEVIARTDMALRADQGRAQRLVTYHSAAALTDAINDLTKAVQKINSY